MQALAILNKMLFSIFSPYIRSTSNCSILRQSGLYDKLREVSLSYSNLYTNLSIGLSEYPFRRYEVYFRRLSIYYIE